MDLEYYESRKGKSRHIEVKVRCEQCGEDKWVRWSRVKKGQGKFCGRKCANLAQKDTTHYGKENARFHWDGNRWIAQWWEETDSRYSKLKNTTKARWLWEMNFRIKLTSRDVVAYKDGNPENCELENLKLISRSESNAIHMLGHVVSDETKRKLSEAHMGKVLSEEHKRKIGKSTKQTWKDGIFDEVHFGEYNQNWKGGVKPYPAEFNDAKKAEIRRRDDHKCQCCGKGLYRSRYGFVHHIDGNKNNNENSNLVLICVRCHGAIHGMNNVVLKIEKFKSMLYQ